MTVRSFSAKSANTSSARVGEKGKLPAPEVLPDLKGVERNFAATVVLRPGWMKAENEDAYLLGMVLKIMLANGGKMVVRSDLCRQLFGREVITQEEEDKLNRTMWELNRLGIIKLHNLEVGQ